MSHRYRMCPTTEQAERLTSHCADARFVWNLALEQANHYDPRRGPTPNSAQRMRQLSEARQGTWLGEGSSSVQQAALRDFDQAMRNWWAGTHRRPTWRKRGVNEGFVIRDVTVTTINGRWAEVVVPKAGRVRFRLSRPMPAGHGMGRVTLDRMGRWHVSFNAPQAPVDRTRTGAVVGIDRGIAATIATSDGAFLNIPTPTPDETARRARLQRKMARQVKGSNRRNATKARLARLTGRQADRRKDWVEKTSTRLVREYDLIVFEDLRVTNMMRSATGTVEEPGVNVAQKRGLNRAIAQAAWSMLDRRTCEKASASADCQVIHINPVGTSQTCSVCGHRSPENRESQADFQCVACGHAEHADINASKNIQAAGLAVAARGAADVGRGDEARTTTRKERQHAA